MTITDFDNDNYLRYLEHLSCRENIYVYSEFCYLFPEDFESLNPEHIIDDWMPYPMFYDIGIELFELLKDDEFGRFSKRIHEDYCYL